jgi:hypothetical protein
MQLNLLKAWGNSLMMKDYDQQVKNNKEDKIDVKRLITYKSHNNSNNDISALLNTRGNK